MKEYILNAFEAQKLDELSINEFKIDGIVLMENAGAKTASWLIDEILKKDDKVLVVAGSGNNAGDGFVVARHLLNSGFDIEVLLLSEKDKYSGDALKNLIILQHLNCRFLEFKKNNIEKKYTFLIDAIFGVGLSREIKGKYKKIIEEMNESKLPVLSIDIPSGLNASSGEIMGIKVNVAYTATYGYLKFAHIFSSHYCGVINLFDISFPKQAVKLFNIEPAKLITKELVKNLLPKRSADSHKYQNGNLLLIGGSHGKSGAIIMSAKAGFRSGVGIATAVTTIGQESIVNASMDELMVVGLLDELGINSENFTIFKEFLKKKTAIVFGPGIVKHESVFNLLTYLVRIESIPLIIDADGLNLISESGKNIFFELKDKEIVLTPHIAEFARLTRKSISEINENIIEISKEYAISHGVVLVLKGKNTIIASQKGELYINNIGNSGMATAGSGDALSGMIGAYMARGLNAFDASVVSVFLHALSGDISAQKTSIDFMNAGDIIENLKYINF